MVTDEERAEILRKERGRIAHLIVPIANSLGWCSDFLVAWRIAYGDHVPEPRDASGISSARYKLSEDGLTETHVDDGYTRPVRPSLAHRWHWQPEDPSRGLWRSGQSIEKFLEEHS